LLNVNDELKTRKAEQKRRAKERRAEDEVEAGTRQFKAFVRDLDEWWKMCKDEAGFDAECCCCC